MELELGLKITRTRDDVTSSSDLRIAKDRTGPIFLSQETEAMFILIVHLKGFRRENVDIEINKDGDRITLSGKKAVQEMVLMGWVMRKAMELRVFRKVFRIPDGIILDRIKAKFNDAESTLTIRMPKLVKGMRGAGIEEVKEEEGQIVRPEATQTISENNAPEREVEEPTIKKVEEIENVVHKEIDRTSAEIETDEIPKIEKDKDAQKEECVEPKVCSKQENDQLAKGESVPQEKPEEARSEIEEETNRAYEMVHGGESKKDGEDLPERVRDTALQEQSKFEDQRELVEAIPPSEEPSGVKATYSETAAKTEPEQVKPEKERVQQKILEPTPAEVDQHEMLHCPKEQEQKQDIAKPEIVQKEKPEEFRPESNKMTINNQVALPPQECTTQENEAKEGEMPQQLEKQEPEINDQEPVEAVPQEEKVEAESPEPAYQPKTVVQETNEEAIDEVESTEGNALEHQSAEAEKQKDLNEGSTKLNKSVPKGSRLCPPLIVAGSAILVSIIVLVISWIRAKKR